MSQDNNQPETTAQDTAQQVSQVERLAQRAEAATQEPKEVGGR
jgi:hypothetical protein